MVKQLTVKEEVQLVHSLIKERLEGISDNAFGRDALIVLYKLILFFLEAYEAEINRKPLRFEDGSGDGVLNDLRSSLNRYFASNAFLCAEAGLMEACSRMNYEAISRRKIRNNSYSVSVKHNCGSYLSENEKSWLDGAKSSDVSKPEFFELLDCVLHLSDIAKKEKANIRKVFKGLAVIRNKSSHLDIRLTRADEEKINFLIENDYQLRIIEVNSVRMSEITLIFYIQICEKIETFFSLLDNSLNQS